MIRVKAARRLVLAGVAALALASAGGAAPKAGNALETVQRMLAAGQKGDCKTAAALGGPLLDRKAAGLPSEMVPLLYELIVGCEVQIKAVDTGYRHALAGTRLDDSTDRLWQMRLLIELTKPDYPASIATLEAMTQGRGAALNSFPAELIWELNREVKDKGDKPLQRRLLKVLASDAYYPDEAYGEADEFRLSYAAILVEAGDQAAARPVVAGIAAPGSLARAMVDPRLRALVPANADVRAATEASLVRHRQAIGRYPDRLGPLIAAASDLRILGRAGEAVELLETARSRIADKQAFSDRDKMLNWWWQGLASSHTRLGHYEPAMAAYRSGAAETEMGDLNVSQVINMAETQLYFRRPQDAVKTLAAFDDPAREGSPFGEMQVHWTRGCALALSGQRGKADADLAYVKAHEKDAPGALSDLLLCLGDVDAAAASYVRRLRDPEQSVRALLALSDYDDPPPGRPTSPFEPAFQAMKKRPDVVAAAQAAGGTRRFNVQSDEF
jgi:tetratricopeptide (TPR) repeat protein